MVRKGIRSERSLLDFLWRSGIAALRVAGSGSTGHPSSDIIAGYRGRIVIIEVKSTRKEVIYLDNTRVTSLRILADKIGGDAWIAVRFLPRRKFFFIRLEDLEPARRGWKISSALVNRKGVDQSSFVRILLKETSQIDV